MLFRSCVLCLDSFFFFVWSVGGAVGGGGVWMGARLGLEEAATEGCCGGKASIPEPPEKEPFLAWERKGSLDLRKPGRESRLEEALRGPGGGMEAPRKEKLPPELMEAARRLCSWMALVP